MACCPDDIHPSPHGFQAGLAQFMAEELLEVSRRGNVLLDGLMGAVRHFQISHLRSGLDQRYSPMKAAPCRQHGRSCRPRGGFASGAAWCGVLDPGAGPLLSGQAGINLCWHAWHQQGGRNLNENRMDFGCNTHSLGGSIAQADEIQADGAPFPVPPERHPQVDCRCTNLLGGRCPQRIWRSLPWSSSTRYACFQVRV